MKKFLQTLVTGLYVLLGLFLCVEATWYLNLSLWVYAGAAVVWAIVGVYLTAED